MPYSTLISADELKPHIGDSRCKIFDVRHDLFDREAGPRAYQAGHIPGARFVHIDDDLSGTKTGRNGRHPLPPRTSCGAARAGHRRHADRRVDARRIVRRSLGGCAVAAVTSAAVSTAGGRRGAASGARPARRRWAASAVRFEGCGRHTGRLRCPRRPRLSSTRDLQTLSRRQEPIDPVAGHVPGALNRPWTQNLTVNSVSGAGATARGFTACSATAPRIALRSVRWGVTACHHVLAMEVAGLPGSALYAGSWSEWIADPARPVHTGAEP
jgi:thiosulfate/3-mercaptopyruvate sulfurtransferase